MTVFLWVMFILYCIQIIIYAGFLGRNDYPRVPSYSPADDVIFLLISIGMGAWAGCLLFL